MPALPYIFRLNRGLLEVDAVETDATLRALLAGHPEVILQDEQGREVRCSVEPGAGAITGRGLGRLLRRFRADLLGIEPADGEGIRPGDGPAPGPAGGLAAGERPARPKAPARFRIVELPFLAPARAGAVGGPSKAGVGPGPAAGGAARAVPARGVRVGVGGRGAPGVVAPIDDAGVRRTHLAGSPSLHPLRAPNSRRAAGATAHAGTCPSLRRGGPRQDHRGRPRRGGVHAAGARAPGAGVGTALAGGAVDRGAAHQVQARLHRVRRPALPPGCRRVGAVERVVASIDTAKRQPHAAAISSIDYDLVIVDEAHHLRNRDTLAWKLVNGLRKRYILLLTATPVQNDLDELFNLITLLRPGRLRTPAEFRRRYVAKGDRLQPRNVEELRRLVREVMIRNRRAEAGVRLPPRQAETIKVRLSPAERSLYDGISGWVRSQYRRLLAGGAEDTRAAGAGDRLVAADEAVGEGAGSGGGRLTSASSIMLKVLQREAGSSPLAVVRTLERLQDPGVMEAAEGSARRHRPVQRAQLDEPAQTDEPGQPGGPGWPVQLKLFADSWADDRAHRQADGAVLPSESAAPSLGQLLELARSAGAGTKAQALLSLLERIDDKVVVFAGFRTTQEALVQLLTEAGLEGVGYHGEMTRAQKEQAIGAFTGRARVLVSTESGGEGRNLQQHCATLVNFDLPWNLMRIEQRIGRLHRIGQRRPVFIFNLAAEGTIESHLLDVLNAKLNLFELVIGELDMILGNLAGEQEFEDTVK